MGKRIKEKRNKKDEITEVTVDLGYEKEYQIETPDDCGLSIGKVHGIGARSMQQDSFGISDLIEDIIQDKGVMAVLADGMGGLSDGERASMATIISCLNYFDTHPMVESVQEELVAMAENANIEVKEVLGGSRGTSGSTLIAVVVKERQLFWVSVGDSRIFLYRDGELTQLSKDHNYAADLQERVEAGEITEEEALSDPQRNALTSYIGIDYLDKIDCCDGPLELFEGDRILLTSDGVYNTLTTEEITDLMQFSVGKTMMHIGMQIEAKRKKNQDNYTAILLEIV